MFLCCLAAATGRRLPAPNGPTGLESLNPDRPFEPTDAAAIAFYAAICHGDAAAVQHQLQGNPALRTLRYTAHGLIFRRQLTSWADPGSNPLEGHAVHLDQVEPIVLAAATSNLATVDVLLAAGADPFATDQFGRSTVWTALALNRDLAIAQRFYDCGVAVDSPNLEHNLLREQCWNAYSPFPGMGYFEDILTAWLLDHGASMDYQGPEEHLVRWDACWDLIAERGLYTEFLDYDWSDQPATEILYYIHRNQTKLPDYAHLVLFGLLLVAVAFHVRRAQWRARRATRDGLAAGDAQAGLSARARKRLDRWRIRLAAENLPVDSLTPLSALYRRAERLRRWTVLPLTAGLLAAVSIAIDPLLIRMPYTRFVWIYAGVVLFAGALQLFAAPLSRLLTSTALAVLALIGAPALAYQGMLMHIHLHQSWIFALNIAAATLLLCLCGLSLTLVRVQWRLWRGEAAIRGALRQARRAEDASHREPAGVDWDQAQR